MYADLLSLSRMNIDQLGGRIVCESWKYFGYWKRIQTEQKQ